MEGNEDFWSEFLTEEGTEDTGGAEVTEETEETEEPEGVQTEETEGAGTETGGGDPKEEEEGGLSDEMLARIEAETQRRVDASIAKQFDGIVNPFTGEAIRTEADLEAYRTAFQAEEQRQQLESMGVPKEALDNYIQNHPAMQQAQALIREQQQQQANDFMAKEFAALKKEFPDCGLENPAALSETEAGKRALQMWAHTPGVSLADAYAATHRKELVKKQSAAAKQAAMNEMNSKGHLTQTKGSNAKGEVPAEIAAEYKKFFPKATAEEIAQMYHKNRESSE